MNLKSIVVTGCGGDIGIAVGRILKQEKLAEKIIGVDTKQHHAGVAYFDQVLQVLPVKDEKYLSDLETKVRAANAEIIIPITEVELAFFIEHGIEKIANARVIAPNREAVLLGLDKLHTYEVLSQAGIQMVETWLVKSKKSPSLPCIMKKRAGHGGKDFTVIQTQEEYEYLSKNRGEDIGQVYLPNEDAEYTCGLFRSQTGDIRTFILRRRLLAGFTGEGVVEDVPEIKKLLIAVAEAIQLKGSINVQLRMTEAGPKIFEINPRFSSTVLFRHLLNFKDVIWSIDDAFALPLPVYQPAKIGTRIYRTFGELILSPTQ